MGPRLRYLEERTKYHKGTWCEKAKRPAPIIPPGDVDTFNIGNDYEGRKPEVDMYYQVYNSSGLSTDCILKFYVQYIKVSGTEGESSTVVRNINVYLRKENEAVCNAVVPDLRIHDTGLWVEKIPWDQRVRFGDAFMVYFDTLNLHQFDQHRSENFLAMPCQQKIIFQSIFFFFIFNLTIHLFS